VKRLTVSVTCLWIILSSIACTQVWLPDERSGLGFIDSRVHLIPVQTTPPTKFQPIPITLERTIRVPLSPARREFFDLYYFVRMPSTGKAAKTVLFCAGGPGQFIPTTVEGPFTDFLTENDYNVVYYHPRGAGFSQISASNRDDRFLKTSYVVDDIEAIRHDLIGQGFLGQTGKWDAVIGYSFGTVVAQYYAGTQVAPGTPPVPKLDRLILVGVESRHGFQGPADPFDNIRGEILQTNRTILENLFKKPAYNLSTQEKNQFPDTVFGTNGIFKRAEEKFGRIGFVVGAYCEIKNELVSNNLNYSRAFFRALRDLRNDGWAPPLTGPSVIIVSELRGLIKSSAQCVPDLSGSSDRVFNVVSIYDGLNMKFLSKWLANGKTNVKDAVRASGGEVHYASGSINKQLEKVGISNTEVIEPWDPAQHKHDTPTLILKGSADTVSAGGAAEYIFLNALSGPRTFINYPGVGHSYTAMGELSSFPSTLPGTACVPSTSSTSKPLRDCLLYSFLEMSPAVFNATANGILGSVSGMVICYRDQTMPTTLTVAGTCP
jgi:pimeloyl-ACP methyl ester carboxylesterase